MITLALFIILALPVNRLDYPPPHSDPTPTQLFFLDALAVQLLLFSLIFLLFLYAKDLYTLCKMLQTTKHRPEPILLLVLKHQWQIAAYTHLNLLFMLVATCLPVGLVRGLPFAVYSTCCLATLLIQRKLSQARRSVKCTLENIIHPQ